MLKKLLFILLLCTAGLSSPCQTSTGQDDQVSQHLRKAQQYVSEQKPELAIPELQDVVSLDPGNLQAQANLGVLLYFRGDFQAAIPHLRAAVSRQADLWKIRALLGMAEEQVQDLSGSRSDLEAAFSHLTDKALQLDVGKILVNNYVSAGELEKAADLTSTLLASRPTDISLLYLSYRIYSDLSGRAMLTMAFAAPGSAEMHEAMARELARNGDDTAAIANLRQAIQINPKLSQAHTELGELLHNSSDVRLQRGAQAEFESALAIDPHDEKAELWLGVIMEQKDDLKAAYSHDSRALHLNPNDSDACTETAKVLVEMNQGEQARAMLQHAVQIDPTNFTAHYRLASLYRQEGKQEEAKRQLAEYSKYKEMNDMLEKIFHNMRVDSAAQKHPRN